MARKSKMIGRLGELSRRSSRRARALSTGAALLALLGVCGCTSVDASSFASREGDRSDIVVLTADSATSDAVLQRLRHVETWPASQSAAGSWSRGRLTRGSAGSVYAIVVGPGEAAGEATLATTARRAIEVWRPRYLLLIGTAPAAAYGDPLGAVGVMSLVCDFDLDRFEGLGDLGSCYRPDGGLLAAARAFSAEWVGAANASRSRVGCSPARVEALGAMSGDGFGEPRFVEVVTRLSEAAHRGVVIERQGASVARAVGELRHKLREPIGFLMIRGVSKIARPAEGRMDERTPEASEREVRQTECATRDAADFAVELIRRQWPVAPSAAR